MKRRRLSTLASHSTNVSELVRLLRELSDVAPDLAKSRWAVARAVKAELFTPTAYGCVLRKMDFETADASGNKGTFRWSYFDPLAMVSFLSASSPQYAAALRRAKEVVLVVANDKQV